MFCVRFLNVLIWVCVAACQDLRFVKLEDYIPTVDSKSFSISIKVQLRNSSDVFNSTIFLTAATSFYSNDVIIGFQSVSKFVPKQNESEIELLYDLNYNGSVISMDLDDVTAIIGTSAPLQAALENDAAFNQTYTFLAFNSINGSKICDTNPCGGSQVYCSEDGLGLNVYCKSLCKEGNFCSNGAICTQEDKNIKPKCRCISPNFIFYIGERCQVKIGVWMIALLVVGILLIFALIILFGCRCMKLLNKEPNEEKQAIVSSASQLPQSSPPPRPPTHRSSNGSHMVTVNVKAQKVTENTITPREANENISAMPDFLRLSAEPQATNTRSRSGSSSFSPEETYPEHEILQQRSAPSEDEQNHGDDERESTTSAAETTSRTNPYSTMGDLSSIVSPNEKSVETLHFV